MVVNVPKLHVTGNHVSCKLVYGMDNVVVMHMYIVMSYNALVIVMVFMCEINSLLSFFYSPQCQRAGKVFTCTPMGFQPITFFEVL